MHCRKANARRNAGMTSRTSAGMSVPSAVVNGVGSAAAAAGGAAASTTCRRRLVTLVRQGTSSYNIHYNA